MPTRDLANPRAVRHWSALNLQRRRLMADPSPHRLLRIYLRDHHAGARAALDLLDRMIQSTSEETGSDRDFLSQLQRDVQADRETLKSIMGRLNISPSRTKDTVSRLGERFGRTKLNGTITGRSPLSRLLEFEALEAGIRSKQRLWSSLQAMAPVVPELVEFDFEALWRAADRQVREVGERHVDVAREVAA